MKIMMLIFALFCLSHAQNYALIVGLNTASLKGAVNDAVAIEKVLKAYKVTNIIVLHDKEATKNNIIKHLTTLANTLSKGDRLYFFFSGHGTSLYDPSLQQSIDNNKELLLLLEDSGALIPWDFNDKDIINSIVSAKRDLAPLFRKLDAKKVFVFVMIDACFSGNNYKTLNFSNQLPIAVEPTFGERNYPYVNIVYLSATSISDWAVEDRGKRPYRGYFSRALEVCLFKYNRLKYVTKCLEKSDIPQSIVSYPNDKDFLLFETRVNSVK